MQKLLFSIPVSANITGTCVWLAGCKKEANQAAVNTDKAINKQSEADRITEQRIRSFRQQAKTNARINENMAVADALWYIEATLNYTFCRGSLGIIDPLADTAIVTLTETSAGMVEFTEVADQYNKIAAQMQANVSVLEQNNRAYMLVDVINLGSNNGLVSFKCILLNAEIINEQNGNCRVNEDVFGPGDNYKYGYKLGRCDGSLYGKTDAALQITNKVNRKFFTHELPVYFTEVDSTIYDDPTIYRVPNDSLDNINDYVIFYRIQNVANFDECIPYAPANQMNFYYNHVLNFKAMLDVTYAPKEFKLVYLDGKVFYKYIHQVGLKKGYMHIVKFYYGNKHYGEIPD